MRKTLALSAAMVLAGCLGSDPNHGGSGTGAGDGSGNGTAGGGSQTPAEPAGCGKQTFPISTTKVAPNIMMVVDESGSMKEPIQGATPPQSKWTALVGAVNALLGKYSGSAQWGMSIFPHTPANACSAGTVDIAVGANTTMSILTKLNGMNDGNIGGNTPTNQSLQAMLGSAAGLADATRANYVLLMTDGQPNCGGDAKAVAATVGQLYGQATSVRTFVVGIGDGASSDPGALNSWADAGHTARAGATKYYQVNTVNDLQQAFADIVNGVASCTYSLTMKPADASLVVGYLNGAAVPSDAANGTTYDPKSNTLEFHGTSCDAIKNGGATAVDVIYGCPSGPIP
ncbi:MAG: putative secreted protein [Myxococcales bacterium]|nr:putative secreted protein [Myxococcales bacterium]